MTATTPNLGEVQALMDVSDEVYAELSARFNSFPPEALKEIGVEFGLYADRQSIRVGQVFFRPELDRRVKVYLVYDGKIISKGEANDGPIAGPDGDSSDPGLSSTDGGTDGVIGAAEEAGEVPQPVA